MVIASRNEFKNLLWTLQSVQNELEGIDHEVIVVLNKCDPSEARRLSKFWPAKTGQLQIVVYDEKPSCWQARNAGAAQASGEYLLCLDSHVMAKPGAFVGALAYHRSFMGILHFGVNYWLEHPARTLYQYKWRPDKFWGDWSRRKPEPPDHRVLMSSFGAAMVDRAAFEDTGRFHPALGIYGGGEPYIDLKLQMFGYEARCNPAFQVHHLTEKRGYSWNSADLHRNFMIAAWAIGGGFALEPLYDNYVRGCKGVPRYLARLEELRAEAIELADDDRLWIEQHAKKTFAEVLDDQGED